MVFSLSCVKIRVFKGIYVHEDAMKHCQNGLVTLLYIIFGLNDEWITATIPHHHKKRTHLHPKTTHHAPADLNHQCPGMRRICSQFSFYPTTIPW